VVEVKVGPNSKAVGKKLSELRPKDVVIAAITREEKLIVPKGETEIQVGDYIVMVGYPKAVAKLAKFFKGD